MAIGPGGGGMRLRPLDIGDVLDETFRMYRRQFVPLVTTMAIVVVPASVLSLIVTLATGFSSATISRSIEQRGDPTTLVVAGGLLGVVGIVAGILHVAAVGAATLITSGAVLGQPISVGDAYRQSFRRFGSLLLAGIATGLPIGLLVLTCIGIPVAFFVGLGWSATFPAIMLEGRGATEGMGRSWGLVRGHRWRLLVCWVLIFVIFYLLVSVPSGLFGFIAGIVAVASGNNPGALALVQAGNILFSAIGQTFFGSVLYITGTILYYDLRIRQEGFDLEQRVGAGAEATTTYPYPTGAPAPTQYPPYPAGMPTDPQYPQYPPQPRYPQVPPPPQYPPSGPTR
jgi:hypothetical protein